jgi:microsomal dipeptidase-like Zn-dependent dipeptidase
MADPPTDGDGWVLSPVLIAAQPISQTHCEPDAFTEHKRNANTKELL